MGEFTVYPAIDLRNGKVVRLKKGDPGKQTQYSSDPGGVARQWLDYGASWLHVINLDGAFGDSDDRNRVALQAILDTANDFGARVQFGGGLRSVSAVNHVLELGVERAIIGTMAVQDQEVMPLLLQHWGDQRIAVSLDCKGERVAVHGWKEKTNLSLMDAARQLTAAGLRVMIFTDIGRDGLQTGVNLEKTVGLAEGTGLEVIASGGVGSWADIEGVYQSNLAGVIVGRALYEKVFDPERLFRYPEV